MIRPKQYLTSLAIVTTLALGIGCKGEEKSEMETFEFGSVSVDKSNFSREDSFDGFELNGGRDPILFKRNFTKNEDTLYRGNPDTNYYDNGCDGSVDKIATSVGNSYRRTDGLFPEQFKQGDLLLKQFKEAFKISDGCYTKITN